MYVYATGWTSLVVAYDQTKEQQTNEGMNKPTDTYESNTFANLFRGGNIVIVLYIPTDNIMILFSESK